MSEAESIAREHVRWAYGAGRSLATIMLEVGCPLPRTREPAFEDAVSAVAHAWIDITLSSYREAA